MKIIVVTPVYPHSGNAIEGLFNEQHALALKERGMNVTVVLCKPWLPDWVAGKVSRYGHLKGLPKKEIRNGIEVLYARYLHVPRYLLPSLTVSSCAKAVLGALERFVPMRFDLMQIHSVWPVGFAAPALSRALRIPFVVTLHIEDDPELYYSRSGRELYQQMVKRASRLVAVGSPIERSILKIMPGFNTSKLFRIPNGITPECVPHASEWKDNGKETTVRIISVCNLWHLKGIDLNLKALALLNEKGLTQWEYVIVGDGPERQSLMNMAQNLGIGDRVIFAGRKSHEEALRMIDEADLFSMPSRSESFGMVYLEAMAYGKPAIGCSDTGAEDIIVQGETGLLVPKENIKWLAEALEKLMSNRTWAKQLGEAGRKRATLFSWQSTAEQYDVLYQEVLRSEKSVCAGQGAM